MTTHSDLDVTTALVALPFGLTFEDTPHSEAALLAILSERIADMLETEPEFLMSLLYRLDVEERKILPVLAAHGPEPVSVGLARLVLERQKQRVETKRTVKVQPLDDAEQWNG